MIETYEYDDDLIEATRLDGQPRLRVYPARRMELVLGRGSKVEQEIFIDACIEDRIPLARRRGGGCSVFIDPGNLIVSLALAVPGIGASQAHFRRISRWLINGLNKIGFNGIEQDGISDLILGDRKIAGACIYRSRNLLFYSATILVAPRIEQMERYLKHPPREPSYRRGRKHSQFVGRLLESISDDQIVEIARQLEDQLLIENNLWSYQTGPADQREGITRPIHNIGIK